MTGKVLFENELVNMLKVGQANGRTRDEILLQFYYPLRSVVSDDLYSLVGEGKITREDGLYFLAEVTEQSSK